MENQNERADNQFAQEQSKADQNRGNSGSGLNDDETVPYQQQNGQREDSGRRYDDEIAGGDADEDKLTGEESRQTGAVPELEEQDDQSTEYEDREQGTSEAEADQPEISNGGETSGRERDEFEDDENEDLDLDEPAHGA